jgi:hypothetical protein
MKEKKTIAIIVDDWSTDNTKNIIAWYIKQNKEFDKRIHYFFKENWWVCDACNFWIEECLKISKNHVEDYVFFLGSDDKIDNSNFWKIRNKLALFKDDCCFIFPMRKQNNWIVSIFKCWDKKISYKEYLSWDYLEWSDKVDNAFICKLSIFWDKSLRFPKNIYWWEFLLYNKIIKKYSVIMIKEYIYIVYTSDTSMTRRSLDVNFYKNQYQLQKLAIKEFWEDLLLYNKKTLWYYYLILSRYCWVLKKHKEWFSYFIKWICLNPFDLLRIWLYMLSNIPFSLQIINFIIYILWNTIEIKKIRPKSIMNIFYKKK